MRVIFTIIYHILSTYMTLLFFIMTNVFYRFFNKTMIYILYLI
jgi:hypothetical protein